MTGVGAAQSLSTNSNRRAGSGHQGKHMSVYEYVQLMEYAHKLEVENERLRQCVTAHEQAILALWAHARRDSLP